MNAKNWEIRVDGFDPEKLNHEETILMTGNGYLCTRGSYAEGYPTANTATFLHGVYDDMPVSFTELANMPNWTALQITLDGERFSLASGELISQTQGLDMRTGTLRRSVHWKSASGRETELKFERFANLAEEHLLCQKVWIRPLNYSGTVEVAAELDGHPSNERLLHWNWVNQTFSEVGAMLHLRTVKSEVDLAIAQLLRVMGGDSTAFSQWDLTSHPTQVVRMNLQEGAVVSIEKLTSVFTSRDVTDVEAAVNNLLEAKRDRSWNDLTAENAAAWAEDWEKSDVMIESTDDAQIMVRFAIYQLLIAAPRHDDQVSIGAKTLSGYGYRGHVFWDTEIFMLPFFTMTQPEIAKNLLSYRWHRLQGARKKAAGNGYEGAQFPWESAGTGEEVTPTWVTHFADPTQLVRIWTGDIQIHITCDIVYALMQYWKATGDDAFMLDAGMPIILETAVFWNSRLEWNEEKAKYELTDVIGPDENHDHVDNNAFTNFMVRWHLRTSAVMYEWMRTVAPEAFAALASSLNLSGDQVKEWLRKADLIYFPEMTEEQVIEQFEGFFNQTELDLNDFEPRTRSMQEILGIEEAATVQILKQADVVMLMYLFRDQFPKSVIEANYDFYSPRTDHTYGSSLGPAMHALVANWIGRPDEAYEHFLRAAKADLYDVRGNVRDGIHAASIGGIWQAVVFGFAGLVVDETSWSVSPKLPAGWDRISFSFYHRGTLEHVDIRRDEAVAD